MEIQRKRHPLNPIHWFQFADDAAVVSGQEKENQMLLNRFTIWCQWAQMIIRVDKCSTFGIRTLSSAEAIGIGLDEVSIGIGLHESYIT